jgi:hypothetical protein
MEKTAGLLKMIVEVVPDKPKSTYYRKGKTPLEAEIDKKVKALYAYLESTKHEPSRLPLGRPRGSYKKGDTTTVQLPSVRVQGELQTYRFRERR